MRLSAHCPDVYSSYKTTQCYFSLIVLLLIEHVLLVIIESRAYDIHLSLSLTDY